MRVIEAGHIYELEWLDGEPQVSFGRVEPLSNVLPDADPGVNLRMELPQSCLIFVNREDHRHPGTQTQEVLRALIDRTMHCDNCLRWPGNDKIIYHLRMALVLHEARALQRKVEKGEMRPESVPLMSDGHFQVEQPSRPVSEDAKIYEAREK